MRAICSRIWSWLRADDGGDWVVIGIVAVVAVAMVATTDASLNVSGV